MNEALDKYMSLLERIIVDPRYIRNVEYGEPREGHPEGTVRAHIGELIHNLDFLSTKVSSVEYFKLLCLIHVHDSFKAESKRDCPITDPQSHASLAASFLKHLGGDDDLVAMVQWHDENYAMWKQFQSNGACSPKRMARLLSAINDWSLFSAFLIIDGCTAGKTRDKLEWFFDQIEGLTNSRFGKEHIIR